MSREDRKARVLNDKIMSMTTSLKIKTFLSLCGILGPALISLGGVIAGFSYIGIEGQAYNPLNHFVSELGELGVSNGAWAFNAGLITGGILNALFMIYLAAQIKHWARYPLGLLGFTASVFGGLVGIFPMNSLKEHLFVALTFFNLGLAIAFLYSIFILVSNKHPFPKWLALPGIINTITFAIFIFYPSDFDSGVDFQEGMAGLLRNRPDFIPLALLEWVVILGILIWFLMLGFYLVNKARNYTEENINKYSNLSDTKNI